MKFKKNIENNHEKISTDSKKKFLIYRKTDLNILNMKLLTNMLEHT